MDLDSDIHEFKEWCIKMNIPSDVIPSDKALQTLFLSKNRSGLIDMINRLRPKDEVKLIKQNILASKMSKIDGNLKLMCDYELPTELKRFKKITTVKGKINDARKHLNELQPEINHYADLTKQDNIKKIALNQQIENLDRKTKILEIKNENLNKIVEKQTEQKKILQEFPWLKTDDCDFKEINLKINDSFKILNTGTSEQKHIDNFKKKFANISNSIVWQILIGTLKQQNEIMKKLLNDINLKNDEEDDRRMQISTSQNYAKHIIILIELERAKKDTRNYLQQYVIQFEELFNQFETKFKIINADTESSARILSEYIEISMAKNYIDSQIEFIQNEITKMNTETGEYKLIKNDETQKLMDSFYKLYENIQKNVDQISENIVCTQYVKEKLLYQKKLFDCLMEKLRGSKTNNNSFNETMVSSFSANDSVFCSTKIGNFDFESSTCGMENTLVPQLPHQRNDSASSSSTSSYYTEYQLIKEIPIFKIKKIQPNLFLHLYPNPYILYNQKIDDEIQEIIDNHLLTGFGITQTMTSYNDLIVKLKDSTRNVNCEFECPNIEYDELELKEKITNQRDKVTSVYDQILLIESNVVELNKKNIQILKFLDENPIKNYISDSRKFNGCTFRQYEQEYTTYYNIVKNST